MREVVKLLTTQVDIMTKIIVQVCEQVKDENERNKKMATFNEVKEVRKEKEKKDEGLLVVDLEHANGKECQEERNKIRKKITNLEEEVNGHETKIGQENDEFTGDYEISW